MKFCAECGSSLVARAAEGVDGLPAGTVIGGYRILELLGEGGMGRVYVGEHIKLGRRVAIKVLKSELATNASAVSRFFAEARAVNRISHDHIVEITDFLEKTSGHNCYIMELLRGEDLGLRLLRAEPPSIATTVEIAIQIASALGAVHAAGIVHRDLKPDNIFLIERSGSRNYVKLLDFGVAKLIDPFDTGIATHTTAAGQIIGTPEYMSPEQAGGQVVDHRTDIYALGVILFELVTGQLPFKAKSFGELVIKHMTVPPRRPSEVAGVQPIPEALEALILDLLAKDREARPQWMNQVEERLRDIYDTLDVPPVPAKRPGTSGPMRVIQGYDSGPVRTLSPGESGMIRRPVLPKADASVPVPARPVAHASTLDAPPSAREPTPPPSDGVPRSTTSERFFVPEEAPADAEHDLGHMRRRTWLIAGAALFAVSLLVLVVATRGGGPDNATAAPAAGPPQERPPVEKPAPSTPAPAAEVQLRFSSTPPGATVKVAGTGEVLGTTPFTIARKRGSAVLAVEFHKDKFQVVTDEVSLSGDGALAAALSAVPVAAKTPPVKKADPPPVVKKEPPPKQDTRPLDKGGTMDVFGGN